MEWIDLTTFWKEIDDATDLLANTMWRSNVMDRISYGAFCYMITEEFCNSNSLDVIAFSQWVADNIKIMNEKRKTEDTDVLRP